MPTCLQILSYTLRRIVKHEFKEKGVIEKYDNDYFNWAIYSLCKAELIGERDGSYFRNRRDAAAGLLKEEDYYHGIKSELESTWAEHPSREYHLRHRFLATLDTHHAGRANTGTWARPDLTVVGGKVLPNLPGKFLDVHTFEVKKGIQLGGLYEALAHQRRSHYSHLMCIWPEEWGVVPTRDITSLIAEATRQGIGVIVLRQHDDATQWDQYVEPTRNEPDPQELNNFLQEQGSRGSFLCNLRNWLKQSDDRVRDVEGKDVERLMLTAEEVEIGKSIVQRLNESTTELNDSDFKDLNASHAVFKRVKDMLSNNNLIYSRYSVLKKASDAI